MALRSYLHIKVQTFTMYRLRTWASPNKDNEQEHQTAQEDPELKQGTCQGHRQNQRLGFA
jgi:hypothetical protein